MTERMLKHEPPLYRLLAGCIIITALTALASGGSIGNTLAGFLRIQRHSARLISDFTLVGGTGSALLNAAIMGALALGLIRGTRVALSGPTVAAVFTVMGFSLFGKTPVNTVPIVAGVWIASRLARKPLSHYLLMALFGTALGPLVSFFAAESGHGVLVSALLGAGAGLLVGTLLPGLSMAMLRMHEGFNLYNIGLACGFFGLFLASFLAAGGHDMTPGMIWNTNPSPAPAMLCVVICGFFLAQARIMEGPG